MLRARLAGLFALLTFFTIAASLPSPTWSRKDELVVISKVTGQLVGKSRFGKRSRSPRDLQLHAFRKRGHHVSHKRARAIAPSSGHRICDSSLPLTARPGKSASGRFLDDVLCVTTTSAPVKVVLDGQTYLTPITIGDQTFQVVIDTASADTWLVDNDFRCVSSDNFQQLDQSQCSFGPAYNNSYGDTFERVPDQNFNISYGDGEFLNGMMAKERVTLADITVDDQLIAIVDYAAWMGDTVSSGLLGMAFPDVTRAYPGVNASLDIKGGNIPYNPVFTTMYNEGLIPPVFSLALPRIDVVTGNATNEGVLALGGLPTGSVTYSPDFVTAPLDYLSVSKANGTTAKANNLQLYTITMDGIVYAENTTSSAMNSSMPSLAEVMAENGIDDKEAASLRAGRRTAPLRAVIDSGTTLIYLPPADARSINLLWNPPAWIDWGTQNYMIPCDAKAPKVGAQISGQVLWIDPRDMLMRAGTGSDGPTCYSAIQSAPQGLVLVGDAFLRSVVTVFDVGAGELRFAARLD